MVADQILASVARCCRRTLDSAHERASVSTGSCLVPEAVIRGGRAVTRENLKA
jgi:hypothetical protein